MFTFFEKLLDPYRSVDLDTMPTTMSRFVLFFARQAWPYLLILLVASAIYGGIEVAAYYFIGRLVDVLIASKPETLWNTYATMLVAMAVLLAIIKPVSDTIAILLGEQTLVPNLFTLIRWQCHKAVSRQSYGYFQNDFAGRLATKVMQSGQAIGDFLLTLTETLWFAVVSVILGIALLAQADYRLTLLFLVWFAAYIALGIKVVPRIRENAKNLSEARSSLSGRIVDSYTNAHTVKLYAHRDDEDAFLKSGFDINLNALRKLTRIESVIRLSMTISSDLLVVAFAAFGIHLWLAGEITPGDLAAALAIVLRITSMARWMLWRVNALFSNYGTAQNTLETITVPLTVTDKENADPFRFKQGEIAIKDVSFSYGQETRVFEELNLSIKPGERIGLVGRSGSGKSTLVNLLLRLYDLDSGKILIDDQNIADVQQETLRANAAMIAQEPSLLHRSVKDNIAYGKPGATDDEIRAAAERADAHQFIEGLKDPKGRKAYEAHVGERGVKLSGGQRQRIALARVFLRNAPILFLDEATSALDSESEALIQHHLHDVMKDKTVIAIAHRLSTVRAMDRLIVLDDGKIVETGTHDELVKKAGAYAALWSRQTGAMEREQILKG